jgi:hypothetical protein
MGPIVCPETSLRNYHYTLRDIPEERGSQSKTFLVNFNKRRSLFLKESCKQTKNLKLKLEDSNLLMLRYLH